MTLTAGLVELIAAKPIDAGDRKVAALLALDAVASMFAGLNSVAGRKLLAWARCLCAEGDLVRLDAGRQAFLLGALCHIQEMDDLHRASVVHPGCAVVPVCLALGQHMFGRMVLDALLWGFEGATRTGMAAGPAHYRVWHATATCGPYGSALAASKLLALDPVATKHALGNAGSQSAGLWEFLESGAETKHLHAGRAAEAGLVAAQLAAYGFTGAATILEGDRGFFRAACPDADPARLLAEPTAPWQAHATSIKPWPSCRHTHPAIEAALALASTLEPTAIEAVEVETYPAALALCDQPDPDSSYAAKFSLQHCVAAALAGDSIGFATFDEPVRQRLAALRGKISVRSGAGFAAAYPRSWGGAVAVKLSSGATMVKTVTAAKGDPESPLTENEMLAKAHRLIAHGGHADPGAISDAVLAMADGALPPGILREITRLGA